MGFSNDTMADVLDDLTQNNWDHVFVVNKEGVPTGRIHAVDVLKIIAKKNVERSVAWMLSVPAQQLVNLPPITVRTNSIIESWSTYVNSRSKPNCCC